jgi:hypothetical protein
MRGCERGVCMRGCERGVCMRGCERGVCMRGCMRGCMHERPCIMAELHMALIVPAGIDSLP